MRQVRLILTTLLLVALSIIFIGAAEAADGRADITNIDLPGSALEGDEVDIGCIVSNPGNTPTPGLSVRFSLGDEEVGVVILDGPLHPGSEMEVNTSWTAKLGRHVVLVEVLRNDVMIFSEISDGSIWVEPVPILEDQPSSPDPDDGLSHPQIPETAAVVKDGADSTASVPVIVIIAIAVAAGYMAWVMTKPARWDD
jgi:hypothetical protein